MALILYFLVLLSLSISFRALMQLVFHKSIIINKRVQTYIGTPKTSQNDRKKKSLESRLLFNKATILTEGMEVKLSSRISKEAKMDLERKLVEAGLSEKWTPVKFRFFQLLIGAFLFISCFLLFWRMAESLSTLLLLAGALGVLGYVYPTFYLGRLKKKRIAKVQKKLADFFDMVNLSVEAGMGLDAALVKVCRNTSGPLVEEFQRTLEEMHLGKSRREAFVGLRNRIPLDAFQSIMTSLIQADQLGLGMSKALAALTERIREHQRQLARETAMKAPIKMLFPMIFFIFPAILVIILGPFIIYLLQNGLGG